MASDTRDRILDTAEELFAERGIAATSLRVLTQAADVNLAAVHYHFGSKDSLLDAVLARRAEAMNVERLADLARIEVDADDGPPTVEAILFAFVIPGVRSLEALQSRREVLARLRSRIEAEPAEVVEALFRRHFGSVCARFLDALERALPDLDKEVIADRFRFAMGSISFAFSQNFDLDTIPGRPPTTRHDQKVSRLIDFIAAGMRAPAPLPPADGIVEEPADGETP